MQVFKFGGTSVGTPERMKDVCKLITDDGTIIRMPVDDLSVIGRVSQGVRVMRVEDEGRIVGVTATERDEDAVDETAEETDGENE